MCKRYAWVSGVSKTEEAFRAQYTQKFRPDYNVHPGAISYIIPDDNPKVIMPVRWGLVPEWFKKWPSFGLHYTAEAKDIVKSNIFRKYIRSQRCLILANCYYQWIYKEGNKQPHVVYLKNESMITMAGVWASWCSPEGQVWRSCSIVTTVSNKKLQAFAMRSPVVIPHWHRSKYLQLDLPLRDVVNLLRPFETDDFNMYPVSHEVNSQLATGKKLIMPVGPRVFSEKGFKKTKRIKNMNSDPGYGRLK